MSDLSLVKAALEAIGEGLCQVAVVIKEKKSLLEEGQDLVVALLADEKFKEEASKVFAAGFGNLLIQMKSMPSDVSGDIELLVAEIPMIKKVIDAFAA